MNKYRNIKTTVDGITFASKHEATRYSYLKRLEKDNIIADLRLQVKYMLAPAQNNEYRKERPLTYIADFVYMYGDIEVVEDAKGKRTDLYIAKRKMMLLIHKISIFET